MSAPSTTKPVTRGTVSIDKIQLRPINQVLVWMAMLVMTACVGCERGRSRELQARVQQLEAEARGLRETVEASRRMAKECRARERKLQADYRQQTLSDCTNEFRIGALERRLASRQTRRPSGGFMGYLTVSIAGGKFQKLRKDGMPPTVAECVERAVRSWSFAGDEGPQLKFKLGYDIR